VLDVGEPKYLNSPETPLFSKGRELYGLFLARNAIRDAGRVVVVEGYMDVVALAQHGIEYAVATLGTATTPTHVQKLFRQTDTVVFCFDGDAAGRKAAWRAVENTLPVLADGKNAQFLFLPDGEDPDDYIRARGKAAFEGLIARATPLSEFLLHELAAVHPPTTAEGGAALVKAARPLLAQLGAPIMAALLRRELAELTGLPETELRLLLRMAATPQGSSRPPAEDSRGESRAPRRLATPSSRRPPSLVRELIQALLLQPQLARTIAIPQPEDGTADGAALAALAGFCMTAADPLTTPGAIQHFAGTPHEPILAAVLATAHDHGVTPEQADQHLRAGVQRYWLQAQRSGQPAAAGAATEATALATRGLPAEETERLRQLELVRRALPPAAPAGSPRGGS
jgi:DNA primase